MRRQACPFVSLRPLCALLAGLGLLLAVGCSGADPAAEARALHREGRFEDSIALLREALDERPDDPELNHLYGIALLKTGRHGLANWPLRKAMEDPAWLVPSALPLASSLLALQNHEAATRVLDRVLAVEPENVDALLLRAQAKLVSRQDYEGALADVERVREIDPDNPRALVPRAAALLGLERLDETAEALEELEQRFRADQLDPGLTARYCLTRATFAREKGDLQLAEERFEKCLADMPLDDGVVIAAVEFHDSQGHADRSLEILREALERAPQATLYRTALAERLEQRGRVDEAERLLREGLEVGGAPDFVTWANLSRHYQRQERYPEAIESFEKAVAAAPDPPPAMLFEFAELLILGGRYERALEVADGIPVPAMQELVRGRVHYERGEYAEALERFEAGLLLWPDNAVARYLAARSAEQLGDFDRAIGDYRYAVRADPAGTDARFRLVELRLAEGDLTAARTEAVQASGRAAPDPEAELAVLRAMAETTRPELLNPLVARLAPIPSVAGRALAAVAGAVARRDGPQAAAETILQAQGLDLTLPPYADALDSLVEYLIASGEPQQARDQVARALAAHPGSSAFRAIEGHRLERSGAAPEAVRAAYQRALEADPGEPRALEGLARLAARAEQPREAVDWYRKAADANPHDPELRRQAASLLLSLGESDEARSELERLLEEYPYDAAAALELGRLLLETADAPSLERALDLGQRARRFGGGAAAESLVATARQRLAARS